MTKSLQLAFSLGSNISLLFVFVCNLKHIKQIVTQHQSSLALEVASLQLLSTVIARLDGFMFVGLRSTFVFAAIGIHQVAARFGSFQCANWKDEELI